jgi:hypothetical protein
MMTGVMNKILIYSITFLLLLLPQAALAQVVITEIMYDPVGTDSGHEWIEVYNAGAAAIPLTSWKLYEGDAKHNIIAGSSQKSLAPKSFAVIAESVSKFQGDYPDFNIGSEQLFHSAFSLDNAGAMIELLDASSSVIDSVSYDSSFGALGDGNSLQRPPDDSAQFSPYMPTPGTAMSTTVIPPKIKAVAPAKTSKEKSAKKKSSKKSAAGDSSDSYPDSYPTETDNTDEVTAPVSDASQLASAGTASSGDWHWWLAVGGLAAVVGGALVAAKHLKKTEWDIVEEKPEDV